MSSVAAVPRRNSPEARAQIRIKAAQLKIKLDKKRKVKTQDWVYRLASGDLAAAPGPGESWDY